MAWDGGDAAGIHLGHLLDPPSFLSKLLFSPPGGEGVGGSGCKVEVYSAGTVAIGLDIRGQSLVPAISVVGFASWLVSVCACDGDVVDNVIKLWCISLAMSRMCCSRLSCRHSRLCSCVV